MGIYTTGISLITALPMPPAAMTPPSIHALGLARACLIYEARTPTFLPVAIEDAAPTFSFTQTIALPRLPWDDPRGLRDRPTIIGDNEATLISVRPVLPTRYAATSTPDEQRLAKNTARALRNLHALRPTMERPLDNHPAFEEASKFLTAMRTTAGERMEKAIADHISWLGYAAALGGFLPGIVLTSDDRLEIDGAILNRALKCFGTSFDGAQLLIALLEAHRLVVLDPGAFDLSSEPLLQTLESHKLLNPLAGIRSSERPDAAFTPGKQVFGNWSRPLVSPYLGIVDGVQYLVSP